MFEHGAENTKSTLELVPAALSQRSTLENLFQLYIHDFSENWAGTDRGELDDSGRFAPYPLDAYWQQDSYRPFFIRYKRALVGFALINGLSHCERPVDHNIAEFFIVRKHRRSGCGTAAAHALFERFSGQWEIAVARRNLAATHFWRRTVMQYPRRDIVEEHDINSPLWNGPILRFVVSP